MPASRPASVLSLADDARPAVESQEVSSPGISAQEWIRLILYVDSDITGEVVTELL